MQVFIYCKITLHFSGVYRTHHQEYIKLYQKLQLQFEVLLMMGVIDTRNMYSNLIFVSPCIIIYGFTGTS